MGAAPVLGLRDVAPRSSRLDPAARPHHGREPGRARPVLLGAVGYLVLISLFSTSFSAQLHERPGYQRFSRVAIYYIWLVFTLFFAGKMAAGSIAAAVLLVLSLVGLGFRLRSRRRSRRDWQA